MLILLSILALVLLAVTVGLSLAHALELPGKMRLDEPAYRTVQAIYYPGFTIGGLIGEVGGMLMLGALLFLIPNDRAEFWWTAAALVLLIACHFIYWAVTHPVNSAWLRNVQLAGLSQRFFGLFSTPDAEWKHMRNVWEWSHVARSVFATLAFISMSWALAQ